MAEQDEAAAEALRGMNEVPDPPHAPGNQFQHDMGQSESPAPAVSGGQGDPQTSTELTDKDMAARAIQYGCADSASNLKRWGRAVLLQTKFEGVEGRSHPPGPHRQTQLVGGGEVGGLVDAASPQTSPRV